MRVLEIAAVDDCFDDSAIREVRLSSPLDEAALRRLAVLGDLEYHPEFPRPFFRLHRAAGGYFKGVLGAESFRIFLPSRPGEAEIRALARELTAALAGSIPPPDGRSE